MAAFSSGNRGITLVRRRSSTKLRSARLVVDDPDAVAHRYLVDG
jgi:hypothetical protein